MLPALDSGAAQRVFDGETDAVPCVLQLLRVLRSERTNAVGAEHYIVWLSDGTHAIHGVLATLLNDVARQGRLPRGTIVLVREFVPIGVGPQRQRACLVMRMDVLGVHKQTIGTPHMLRGVRPPSPPRAPPPRERALVPPPAPGPPARPARRVRRSRPWPSPPPAPAPPAPPARPRPPLVGGMVLFGTDARLRDPSRAAAAGERPKRKRRHSAPSKQRKPPAGQPLVTTCYAPHPRPLWHLLASALVLHVLHFLSFRRRAVAARMSKRWRAAYDALPPWPQRIAFAVAPVRKDFAFAVGALPFLGYARQWFADGADAASFRLRRTVHVALFLCTYTARDVAIIVYAIGCMPLLRTVHVFAGPPTEHHAREEEHPLVVHARAAGGVFPAHVRLWFMAGHVHEWDTKFAREVAALVAAHPSASDLRVRLKVVHHTRSVVTWTHALGDGFIHERVRCERAVQHAVRACPSEVACLVLQFACACTLHLFARWRCALPAGVHRPVTVEHHTGRGRCLTEHVVVDLGRAVARLQRDGAADGRLVLSCTHESCWLREARLSAVMDSDGVAYEWTRRGCTDAFRLHPFMPSCWLSWEPTDIPW